MVKQAKDIAWEKEDSKNEKILPATLHWLLSFWLTQNRKESTQRVGDNQI